MTKPKLKAVPTETPNILRDFERKQLRELTAALEGYQEVLDTKWLRMVQPLMSMAVKYGAATTPDEFVLLESVYKDQLSTAVGHRAHFARLKVKEALEAIANGYGWYLVDTPPKKKRRK